MAHDVSWRYQRGEKASKIGRLMRTVASSAHGVVTNGAYRVQQGAHNDLTVYQWLAVCASYEYRCAYCGLRPTGELITASLGIDHIIPLSRGGDHSADNIVPSCLTCNCSKANLTPLEWIWLQHGLLKCVRRRTRANLRAA